MALYAVSKEGVDSLNRLSRSLIQTVNDIDAASNALYKQIEDLEDGLGIYEKDILICIRQVLVANRSGKESVTTLVTQEIPKRIQTIEELMYMFGDSSDDEDEPPQKKLVLRRHR